MIVCICKNVNTTEILDAVRLGARSMDDIRSETGASSCCGQCQFRVNGLLQDALPEEQATFYNASVTA